MVNLENLGPEEILKKAQKYGRKPYMTAEDMEDMIAEDMKVFEEILKEGGGVTGYFQSKKAGIDPFKID